MMDPLGRGYKNERGGQCKGIETSFWAETHERKMRNQNTVLGKGDPARDT